MWMPSVYLLFTGVLVGLFWSGATLFEQSLVAIGLVWVTVLVGIQTLEVGKKVTGASAALKVAIILTIGIGAVVLAIRHGAANSFAVGQMLPDFGIAKTFLPVIIYQLLGFELVSSMAGEMKDPARHIPRAILLSGIVVATLYVLGTVGMLLALPLAKIGLTEGLVDTFKAIFGGGSIFVWVLAAGAMATYFGNMVTWTLGANKAAAEVASAGEMPSLLAREGRKGTPVWAFLLTGVISTAVLLFAGLFISSQDNLYYALFAASSAIFLLPYLLLFPAVIRLRRIDPGTARPFRVPGGEPVLWLAVLLAAGSVLAALVLFVWTPGVSIDWSYTGPLLGIVAAAIVGGEVVVFSCFHGMPRTPRIGPSAGDEPTLAATTGGGAR